MPADTLTLPPQTWMRSPQTQAIFAALGGQARFVGGCVRNALLGLAIVDVDLCTPLLPQQAARLVQAAGISVIPTGIRHGTITALVDKAHQYEITTLRRDLVTDGRHAVVAYTDDWAEDAARRDLTMNALYADQAGRVYDPTGFGVADALAGRVRFVGDPDKRIQEDVLRLLRFFRFYAQYGREDPDAAGLAACARLAPQLRTLSGERIWQELQKLVLAPAAAAAWALMVAQQITPSLLPVPTVGADGLARLAQWCEPDPVARLAALVPFDAALHAPLCQRLRLSNAEKARLLAYLSQSLLPPEADAAEAARRRYHHGALLAALVRLSLLRAAPDSPDQQVLTLVAQADGPIIADMQLAGIIVIVKCDGAEFPVLIVVRGALVFVEFKRTIIAGVYKKGDLAGWLFIGVLQFRAERNDASRLGKQRHTLVRCGRFPPLTALVVGALVEIIPASTLGQIELARGGTVLGNGVDQQ